MHRLLILLAFAFTTATFAHPGAVDKNGGHTDKKTGVYHLHTKPAPQTPAPKKPEAKKETPKKKK